MNAPVPSTVRDKQTGRISKRSPKISVADALLAFSQEASMHSAFVVHMSENKKTPVNITKNIFDFFIGSLLKEKITKM